MNLQNLKQLFVGKRCKKIFVKRLSPNDNSKNQVYLGGSFEILNILPVLNITSVAAGDWKRERFKASISFSWLGDEGQTFPAPQSQLILYPKYPEVRFSGFLSKCDNPPSELMTQRLDGRFLFFGVSDNNMVLGYVAGPDSELARELNNNKTDNEKGVFRIIELSESSSDKSLLLSELYRIHKLEWIDAKRLDKSGNVVPCDSSNCGGYTLEAELGIKPNGFSEPDYLGWEIKQFGVRNFKNLDNSVITLMTPEPTHGVYASEGAGTFLHRYGYPDRTGREDRINFGGIYKAGVLNPGTNLVLHLIGFDPVIGKIKSAGGSISLIDQNGNEAASWSFASVLKHWNRKHNQACYVPSLSDISGARKYKFSEKVILGTGTDFELFLQEMAIGHIYYDPGIKMENVSKKPKIKKRSQFRIKSKYLDQLYKKSERVSSSEYKKF